MSRHRIQIKALLESKRLTRSIFNPQNPLTQMPQATPSQKNLKRSESSSSFPRKGKYQISHIEQKFRKLQADYKAILEQTKVKASLFKKQKSQIEKYKLQSEKDKIQIQRLRAMLGFIKKEDFGVQFDGAFDKKLRSEKEYSKISDLSKAEKSTDAGLIQTNQNWNSRLERKSTRKDSRPRTPYRLMKNKSQTQMCFRSPLKQSNTRMQLSKYKFVPTLSFN